MNSCFSGCLGKSGRKFENCGFVLFDVKNQNPKLEFVIWSARRSKIDLFFNEHLKIIIWGGMWCIAYGLAGRTNTGCYVFKRVIRIADYLFRESGIVFFFLFCCIQINLDWSQAYRILDPFRYTYTCIQFDLTKISLFASLLWTECLCNQIRCAKINYRRYSDAMR